ncbi:MAG: FAD:protein FMN transferase [Clostridiales bacterium]|nr:FAD:protein FMN transferase [Clostridiales bacterium]
MKKSKKSKIIISTVAVIAVIALAVVGFFVYKNKMPYEEKSAIGFTMGSVVTVKSFGNKNADSVEKDVVDALESYGSSLSDKAFDSSCLSSKFNGDSQAFDADEIEAISKAKEIYSKTDGKAALTVGALSSLWNFNSGKNTVPEKEKIEAALKLVDDENIIINSDGISVSGGSILDVGSIGKGFACDRAAKMLDENGIENAVVAVGGSIYAKGHTAPGRTIRVGIRNPFGNENEYLGYIPTDNAFISTSGNYEKVFEKDGKKYHHLLDCTTGYPVEGELVSVTVICDNGAKSDALSTACFVMGYGNEVLKLLKEENAQAVFVFSNMDVITTPGLVNSFHLTDNSFTWTYV